MERTLYTYHRIRRYCNSKHLCTKPRVSKFLKEIIYSWNHMWIQHSDMDDFMPLSLKDKSPKAPSPKNVGKWMKLEIIIPDFEYHDSDHMFSLTCKY